MRDDVGEQHDLAAKLPDKVAQLHVQLTAWRNSIHAPLPTANKPTQVPASQADSAKRPGAKAKRKARAGTQND